MSSRERRLLDKDKEIRKLKGTAGHYFTCTINGAIENEKLKQELDRTRKALEIAKNAINSAADHNIINCVARGIDPRTDDVSVTLCNALEQITALEQKDKR